MYFLDQPLDHTRTRRTSRSPLDANPWQGPYRAPSKGRGLRAVIGLLAVLGLFALLGVLLAWRG